MTHDRELRLGVIWFVAGIVGICTMPTDALRWGAFGLQVAGVALIILAMLFPVRRS